LHTPTPPSFEVFLARLRVLVYQPDKAAALADAYLAAHAGALPIIEGTTAHFLCREQPRIIAGVGGDWNGYDARQAILEPIGGGLLHYARAFEPDARLDYLFFGIDAAWRVTQPVAVNRVGLLRLAKPEAPVEALRGAVRLLRAQRHSIHA
jgi:hypothetical protein